MKRSLRILGPMLSLLWAATSDARTWHVKPDGTGDAPTIRAAIDSAAAGDELLLAVGTYTWTSEHASPFSMLTIEKPNLTLRGESGAAATILDAEFQWRILRCRDVGSLVIEGLTFQRGLSHVEVGGTEGFDSRGGAIYVSGNSQPIIRRCVFRNNRAIGGSGGAGLGGAINCDAATIEGCEFTNNQAGETFTVGFGGAISSGAVLITNCVFQDNVAVGDASAGGGAISCMGATIRGCEFEGNISGAHIGAGGGAVFEGGTGTIESCFFTGNRVSAQDMSCTGGAVIIGAGTISDCSFVSNLARSSFFAVARGGAISAGQCTLSRCIFIGNSALRTNPDGPGFGGAIRNGVLIENCTLVGNSGGDPSGIGGILLATGATLRSVIVAYTTQGATCSGTGTWSCSDLFGNIQGDTICGTDAGGNFSADPEFCATDPSTSLSVTLQSDSPCAPGNHPQGQACGLIGAGPIGCGTIDVQPRSWSQIKLLYR